MFQGFEAHPGDVLSETVDVTRDTTVNECFDYKESTVLDNSPTLDCDELSVADDLVATQVPVHYELIEPSELLCQPSKCLNELFDEYLGDSQGCEDFKLVKCNEVPCEVQSQATDPGCVETTEQCDEAVRLTSEEEESTY